MIQLIKVFILNGLCFKIHFSFCFFDFLFLLLENSNLTKKTSYKCRCLIEFVKVLTKLSFNTRYNLGWQSSLILWDSGYVQLFVAQYTGMYYTPPSRKWRSPTNLRADRFSDTHFKQDYSGTAQGWELNSYKKYFSTRE